MHPLLGQVLLRGRLFGTAYLQNGDIKASPGKLRDAPERVEAAIFLDYYRRRGKYAQKSRKIIPGIEYK